MSRERAELSKKNPYHIPRYRYYELKYFCRQYDDWKKALTLIDGWQTSPNDISGIIKGCPPVSQTERIALSRVFYSSCIDIVDRCIAELDTALAPYIKKGVTEGDGYMEKLFISCPMRARTAEQIHATMDQMHKIAEAIFGEELEVIPTYFEGTPPENANDRLWYLGKSIEKMSEADCFIGIFDDQKAYDGCIIENHVAKLYGVPQYLVNIAYVAPDIMEQRLQHMV